jgi:hypothetical protein
VPHALNADHIARVFAGESLTDRERVVPIKRVAGERRKTGVVAVLDVTGTEPRRPLSTEPRKFA